MCLQSAKRLTVSLEKTQKNEIEPSWLLRLRILSPIPSISAKNVFYLIREILSFDYFKVSLLRHNKVSNKNLIYSADPLSKYFSSR